MKREKRNVKFVELWDAPSKKGFPTKNSVLLTIALDISTSDKYPTTIGVAVKVPGDQPVPKIGKAIAVKGLNTSLLDVMDDNKPENDVLHYLWYRQMKFNSKITKRIECIVKQPNIGIKESYGKYRYEDVYLNCIED